LNDNRIKRVAFGSESIRKAFLELKTGRFEDRKVAGYIQDAINELARNPLAGIPLPRKLWPKEYVRKFGINNLRKCNLSDGWRLTYTLKGSEVEIVSIILEWFPHKEYDRRFGYKSH
jgi:Txe/YoeB family toxin of Txe-Axe toxin-antitoxin module